MSRKKKTPEAVPAEILAEGSGPVAAEVSADDTGEPVAAAEPEGEAMAETRPAKRRRGRRAAEPAPTEEVADAEAISAAVAARADDVADDLAADASDAVEVVRVEEVVIIEEVIVENGPTLGDGLDASADVDVDEEVVADSDAVADGPLLPAAMDADQLRKLVEALIFATDKPITLQRLRQLSRISDVKRIEQALAELAEDYKDRGIALHQVSGGYQFRTNTAFSPWVQQLIAGRPVRLSRAQLETLAIIAYRQPITRPEIDEIRGVDSSATLRLLLDRALVRVLGKREEVGRPILYGTTKEFLDFFSLSDLRELPTLREYSELTAESRQVMSDRLGVPLGEEPSSISEMGVGVGDIDVGIGREPTGEGEPGEPGDPAELAGSFPAASAAAAADASDAAIDAAFERDDTGTDDDHAMVDDDELDGSSSSEDPDELLADSSDDELASASNADELEDSLSARAARRLRELDDRDPDGEVAVDATEAVGDLEVTADPAAELDPVTFDHEPGEPAHEPIDEPTE